MSKITERFLVVNTTYVPDPEHYWMIISDYLWWNKNEYEIVLWTKECLDFFQMEGMMLKFTTEADRNLFIIRWAYG